MRAPFRSPDNERKIDHLCFAGGFGVSILVAAPKAARVAPATQASKVAKKRARLQGDPLLDDERKWRPTVAQGTQIPVKAFSLNRTWAYAGIVASIPFSSSRALCCPRPCVPHKRYDRMQAIPPPSGFSRAITLWPSIRAAGKRVSVERRAGCFTTPATGPRVGSAKSCFGWRIHACDDGKGRGRRKPSWLAAHGVAAFVLRYRLSPAYRYPVPMLDGARAIRFVRSHAADSELSPERSAFGASRLGSIWPVFWPRHLRAR